MIADKHTHTHTHTQTDRQTDRHAHHNTPLPYRGGVINILSFNRVLRRQSQHHVVGGQAPGDIVGSAVSLPRQSAANHPRAHAANLTIMTSTMITIIIIIIRAHSNSLYCCLTGLHYRCRSGLGPAQSLQLRER